MILDVNADGVVIPKEWFDGVDQVEIRREGGRVVVAPVGSLELPPGYTAIRLPLAAGEERISIFDPVRGLGANPVDLGITDASVNLDEYVYGDPHREKS